MNKKYLITLIEEKGRDIDETIKAVEVDGHFGLTYENLIDFVVSMPGPIKAKIKNTLVAIDFKNGDVFHYLDFLAKGMIRAI